MAWDRWYFEMTAKRRVALALGTHLVATFLVAALSVYGVINIAVLDDTPSPLYDNGFFWRAVTLLASLLAQLRLLYKVSNVHWSVSHVDRSVIVAAWVQVWCCCITFQYTEGTARGVAPYLLGGFPVMGALIGAPMPLSVFMTGASILVAILVDLHSVFPEVKFARYSADWVAFTTTSSLALAFGAAYLFAAVFTNRVRDAEKTQERQAKVFCSILAAVSELDVDLAYELLDTFDNDVAMRRQKQSAFFPAAAGTNVNSDDGNVRARDDSDDQLVVAVERCVLALDRLRPYLPLAMREANRDANDDDFASDSSADGSGDDDDGPFDNTRGGGGGVGSSFDVDDGGAPTNTTTVLRERTCTVLHVECVQVLEGASTLDIARRASEFATVVLEQVLRNDGCIDHMTTWAITASFNGQSPCPRHAKRACSAALGLVSRLQSDTRLEPFVAIDTRRNLCGVCGVDRLRARVVSGNGVELARRLPRLGRHLRAPIIITENVKSEVSSHFATSMIDIARAYNLGSADQPFQEVMLYELRATKVSGAHDVYIEAYLALKNGKRAHALERLSFYERLTAKHDHQSMRLLCIANAMPEDEELAARSFVREEVGWTKLPGEDDANKFEMDETERDTNAAARVDHTGAAARLEEAKFEGVLRDLRPDTIKGNEKYVDDEGEEGGLISMFCFGGGSDDGNNDQQDDRPQVPLPNPAGSGGATPPRRPLPPLAGTADAEKNWVDHLPPIFSDDVLMEQWMLSKHALGEGAFSSVYLGMSLEGLLVAMKCVDLKAKQTDKNSLSGEVARMRKLQHHNIVSYISCANIGRSHFIIIMEYVSGGSLKHVLETFGPPPLPAVRKYVTDLLRGLKYLHDNGMIHCDIKPHNALLTPDGSVKLSDFGSSVNVTLYGGGKNADFEEEVLVRGTSYYLAPEACRNEITSAVDIWSVGVTVLELLSGKLPWEIKGSEANFIRELGKNPDMYPVISADIPSNAAAFCKLCLTRDPAMRPTADALLRTPFLSG